MKLSGWFGGLSTLDLQYALSQFPAPNQKLRAERFLFAAGGPAFNAAATFAFLGGETRLASVIGQHPLASSLRQAALRYRLELIDLAPAWNEAPPLSTVLTTASGERSIINTPRLQPSFHLPAKLEPEPSVLLLDGAYLEATMPLARWAKEKGIPVILDGGSWKPGTEELLPLLTAAICSADFRPPEGAEDVLDFLQEKGVPLGAVTRGEQPIRFYDQDQRGEMPVAQVDAVDTLGAGDVFHGAFCYYFAQTPDFTRALQAAAQVAARSCQYLGSKTWMEFPYD